MKEFFRKNKITLLILFFIGIVVYGIRLFCYTISIDTEILINDPKTLLSGWIALGRFGLVGLKRILGLIPINIIVTNIVAYIILYISIIIWIINLTKLENKSNNMANLAFGLIIMTSPLLAEQFSFTLQGIEISIAFLFIAIAMFFIERWLEIIKEKSYKWQKIILPILSIILLTIAFGCYQAFVALFITICVFFVLVKYKEKIDYMLIMKYAIIFFISLISYYAINSIVQKETGIVSSGYLTGQIYWGKESVLITIARIVVCIGITVLGYGIENNLSYLLLVIFGMIYLIKKYRIKENKMFYLCTLFLIATPFLTTFIRGSAETYRARFSFIFLIAFGVYHFFINSNGKMQKFIIAIAIYTIIIQSISTILLFYSDYNRYKEDVNLANEINNVIEKMDTAKPVVFVGMYHTKTVLAKGEALGYSFFEWDVTTEYGVNLRANGFLKTLGIKYNTPTIEQIKEAEQESLNVPVWPDEKAIVEKDNYIIVNLGEEKQK